jgi:polyphosphate kinase
MSLPFDGAISAFFETEAPEEIRAAIREGDKKDILDPTFPYDAWMKKKAYEEDMEALQHRPGQAPARREGVRPPGRRRLRGPRRRRQGRHHRRFRENLNPRGAASSPSRSPPTRRRAVVLPALHRLAADPGEIVLFDRSWYNRGVVEKVFGFCTDDRARAVLPPASRVRGMIVDEGITFVKSG